MNTATVIKDYFNAKSNETQRLYKRGIDLFNKQILRQTPVKDISEDHFTKYCQWLAEQELSLASQHAYAKGARRLLHYMSRNRLITIRTDVLLDTEKENIKRSIDKQYRLPKGVREFAAAYHNFPAPPSKAREVYLQFLKERAFIGILESTGTRITAAIESKVININWDSDPVKISVIGKGAREHTLRVDSRQARYLKQWLSERGKANDYIFPSIRGEAGHMSDETGRNILARWIRLVLGDGFHFTPHALRHLFITRMRDKHGLEMAQQLIEHKSIQTTSRYPDARAENELDKAYKAGIK